MALSGGQTASDGVALYLFNGGSWVVENFNEAEVPVAVNGEVLSIPARNWLLRFVE